MYISFKNHNSTYSNEITHVITKVCTGEILPLIDYYMCYYITYITCKTVIYYKCDMIGYVYTWKILIHWIQREFITGNLEWRLWESSATDKEKTSCRLVKRIPWHTKVCTIFEENSSGVGCWQIDHSNSDETRAFNRG